MKQTTLRQYCSVMLAALLLGGLVACDRPEPPAPQESSPASATPAAVPAAAEPVSGGLLRDSSIGEPSTLLAPLASDSASFDIIGLVYDTLLEYDENYNITGKLARSWEILEEGLVIRFHLHDNVRFHDGKPLTADDVVHSFHILMDPRTPTSYAANYARVKDIKALDPLTVEVRYHEVFAPALSSWASFHVIPKHLVPTAENITENPLNRAPVGSGPYVFESWQSGSKLTLKANEDYFQGRPNIDQYVYRIIPDQQTIFLELKASNLDRSGLTPLQWERQTNNKTFLARNNKFSWNRLAYTYMGFNQARAPFDEKNVRQALNYAINRDEIIQGVLLGLARPAQGPFLPGLWYSHPKPKDYPYDPVKAKKLLETAGFKDSDGDGILDRNGTPFVFELVTNQGNSLRQQTAEIIQRNLKDIGIEMTIRIVEWSAFLEKFVNARNYDALILGWGLSPEPDQFKFWHSSQTGPTEFNFVGFNNSRVDQILVEAQQTMDQEVRAKLYRELQEILQEEVPYAWLYIPDALAAVSTRIQGIEVKPAGIGYNFEEWWIAVDQRLQP